MAKKKWYKKIEMWIAISALGVSVISAFFSYQANQINKEDFICNDASSKLEKASEYIEYQKSCNLSMVAKNDAILRKANGYYIQGNCSKAIEELKELNLTQCGEKKHLIGGIELFTILAIVFIAFITVISLAISSKTRTQRQYVREKVAVIKKQPKGMDKRVGNYSFIIGVIIAIVLGVFSLGTATPWLASLLVILGLIVGFLNVAGKETKDFLLVAVVLIIAASMGGASATLGGVQYIGQYLSGIFTQVLAFVIPAIVVVALKKVMSLTEKQ